jgi:hypothetical protein
MAGNINLSNQQWLVKSFDSNKNGVMDELKVDPQVRDKVDTDNDGKITQNELLSAIKSDAVEINQGTIVANKGSHIYVEGLETLKSVRATADSNWGHVYTPTLYQDDTLQERFSKVEDSNSAYRSAVGRQRSALRSIAEMTSGKTDATSRAINIQAETALNSTRWNSLFDTISFIGGERSLSEAEAANSNLQSSFSTLNNTIRAISKQTEDLPDVKGSIQATDKTISGAFSTINAIENHAKTPQQVNTRLNSLADQVQAESGGRTGLWGGIGAGVGAVGGAAIGYFAGGKNMKSAAIGFGTGLAVGGGIGALSGNMKDKALLGEAQSLRQLAGDVTQYNPNAAKNTLMGETQNLYQQTLHARETHDLDNARVNTNSINKIQQQVNPVAQEANRILDGYNK